MSIASARPVDVIVPVTRDVTRAAACVTAVLGSRNATAADVVVVAGTDVARAFIAAVADDARVRVIVAGGIDDADDLVQRGIALHPDRDVVVLHPDADVHGDWLDRLAAHAAKPPAGIVASFCPGATGTEGHPVAGATGVADPASSAALDGVFATVNRGQSAAVSGVDAPCVYMTRACLTAIGRAGARPGGARESIEFARLARAAGFDVRMAGDVFVGGCSRRAEVADVERDAIRLFAGRVAVATRAASPRPAIVFVSHGWGGGIRRHMDDVAALVAERADVLYLEPADATTVKLYAPRDASLALWFRLPEDLRLLADTLAAIGVVRLHYHHVNGLPLSILELPAASGLRYDCTLHDYYAICPQYHLADVHGRYCGEPDEAACDACIGGRPNQWNLGIGAWRATLGAFVRQADRVIAPSRDVAERIGRHLPGIAIDVWSHPERAQRVPPHIARIVTIGALSREKGLGAVVACARDARARGLPLTFRVLGPTSEPLPRWPDASLTVHGSYDERALPELVAAERPDVLFFPAQVPETYAYTLSVALSTAVPIVASALGAFTERLAGRADVRLLPFDATAAQWNAALLDASRAGRASAAARASVEASPDAT